MLKKSEKRDQYTMVLEDLRSHFKVFGEALSGVRDEVKDNSKRLGQVESDLEFIKGELALIRHHQVTRDEFKFLETRVSRLEKQRR